MLILLCLLLAVDESVRAPPPPAPVVAPQLTRPPALTSAPPAVYPPDRLTKGETADVATTIDLDDQGNVTSVVPDPGAAPDFEAAAIAAIKMFKFSPAEFDGKPAPVRLRYVYHFVLEKKLAPRPPPEALGTIKGEVSEAGNRKPVAGADVTDDSGQQASTDAQGRYELKAPRGERTLTFSAPGFDTRSLKVTVSESSTVEARRAFLHRTAVGDLQATVAGEKAKEAPTKRTLTHDELINVPGSLNDPIRAVQNLPGLARAPFLGGQLLVRGSPPADTGTYLDGHRIPQLYHFLGGPSVINEQLLDRIDFYPGGYGAYYGRNLVGAIDVGTRKGDPNALHGQASLDLLEAVAFVEGPLGDHTTGAIAARRSHIDLFLPLFIPNNPDRGVTSVVPVYWDYQARLDHKLASGDDLALILFGSDDSLSIIQKGGKKALPLSLSTHIAFHRAIVNYKHAVSDDLTLTLSPAFGWTKQSFDTQGAGTGGFAATQSGDITVLTGELRGEARWKLRSWAELHAGVDLEVDRAAYSIDIQSSLDLRSLGVPITQETQFDRVQPEQLLGQYVEAVLQLGKLQLTPGLRADEAHWRQNTRATLDPRLWGRYALDDETSLKAYVGLYHQPPSGLQIDDTIGNPALSFEWAAQFGLGAEKRFSDLWTVSLEGFYNRRGSLVTSAPATQVDGVVYNPKVLNQGIGRAFGLEVLIRREITSKLYGWVAYTLSKSQILNRPSDPWRAFQFDQPHILTVLVGYRPAPQWELSSRFRLVSGNPLAPVTGAVFNADSGSFVADRGNFGDARNPAFLQLDARAQYTWTFTYWQLSLYLDVQNVTNHVNEEIHLYDYRFREQGSISGIPILPTFGLKGKF